MDKEKLSKGICIIVIIILVSAGLSRCAASNSMTLKEYAAQQEQQN